MATRKPTSQSSAGNYDGFRPSFEWKEDKEAKILLVHVPGYTKEDLRVMYVCASRTLRVTGQQGFENKFNKLFWAPDDCDVTKIHAKFENGTLSITFPKKVLQAAPKEEVQTRTPKESARTPLKEKSPVVPVSQNKDDQGTASYRGPEVVAPEAKYTSSTTHDGKKAEEKKERIEGNGVITDEIKKPETEASQELKESAMMGENSKEEDFIAPQMKDTRNVAAQAKDVVQNLPERLNHQDGCRKLMTVNVGATLMAILAIGAAYAFYKLRS